MIEVAKILLIRKDGAFLLQQRDDKPGIAAPGLISAFGGGLDPGETPLHAAVREINEETNLNLSANDLHFLKSYRKTMAHHGEDSIIHYYIAKDIDDTNLQVFEGQGAVVLKSIADLPQLKTTTHLNEVLRDYFSA